MTMAMMRPTGMMPPRMGMGGSQRMGMGQGMPPGQMQGPQQQMQRPMMQQPMMGPRPIAAPFGTPEFYRELGQQNAAITGDATWSKMGTPAQMAPQGPADTQQNLSQTDPAAWRARVKAMTGQDPVPPGAAMPQAVRPPQRFGGDPRAALAQALMRRFGRQGFNPSMFGRISPWAAR